MNLSTNKGIHMQITIKKDNGFTYFIYNAGSNWLVDDENSVTLGKFSDLSKAFEFTTKELK